MSDDPSKDKELGQVPSQDGGPTYDVVFGEITQDGPNYRNVPSAA